MVKHFYHPLHIVVLDKYDHSQVSFGKVWMREYLPTLQATQKWLKKKPNYFSVEDLVLVVDKDVQRGRWPKGLIEEVFPDTEGIVRRVTVRTTNSTY